MALSRSVGASDAIPCDAARLVPPGRDDQRGRSVATNAATTRRDNPTAPGDPSSHNPCVTREVLLVVYASIHMVAFVSANR